MPNELPDRTPNLKPIANESSELAVLKEAELNQRPSRRIPQN